MLEDANAILATFREGNIQKVVEGLRVALPEIERMVEETITGYNEQLLDLACFYRTQDEAALQMQQALVLSTKIKLMQNLLCAFKTVVSSYN